MSSHRYTPTNIFKLFRVLEWTPIAGAVECQVVVSDLDLSQGWIATTSDAYLTVKDNWLGSSLVPGNRYEWFVSVRNDYAWSEYSEAQRFVIAPTAANARGNLLTQNLVIPSLVTWRRDQDQSQD